MTSEYPALKHVLFICYAFPPVGGAGVQRSVKFVKYLDRSGWKATVLTVQNPSVPVLDHDLIEDIPKDVVVVRSRSLEPAYGIKTSIAPKGSNSSLIKRLIRRLVHHWLQPDLQILWNRSAFKAASKVIKEGGISAIYVSAPPFSSFLIGCRLKEKFGLPLVLDFRDEWSISAKYLENQNHGNRTMERQIELFQRTISQADAVVATTEASAEELARCCERVKSNAIVKRIYNGFDPSDFESLEVTPNESDRFRLVYTGTLWRLTDIEPLVIAIEKLNESHPSLSEKIELQIVGRKTKEQIDLLDRVKKTEVTLTSMDYLPHQQSLQVAKNADCLLLLLANQEGAERVVPAKLFEYLALGRQMLAIVPEGEVLRILSQVRDSTSILPNEIDSIVDWLVKSVQSKRDRTTGQKIENRQTEQVSGLDDLRWCTRPFLASQLAGVLNQVTSKNA